jgi:WD domain, G-beta repeat/APAF-1 helical domain
LAVLPEDEDVPIQVIAGLWAETGNVDEGDADDLIQRLQTLSLLQNLDRRSQTLRLHDNMIWYLRDRIGPPSCGAAHAAMVRALLAASCGQWANLPADHTYGWRFLIRHLRAASQNVQADQILVDYEWIKGKLRACGSIELYESYLPESAEESVRLVGRSIALSLPALAANPRELARQIFGRLGGIERDALKPIVAAARNDSDFCPAPRWPGFNPPGAERLRLVGHEGAVLTAVFSPDGNLLLTASEDDTARLWDAGTGMEIRALRGHKDTVASGAFSPDGTLILTASADNTARLWDATTGTEIRTLRGHHDAVMSGMFSPDGTSILTSSADRTVRLWNVKSGTQIRMLRAYSYSGYEEYAHFDWVLSAVFSTDGARILTASCDRTAALWDATTGERIRTFQHKGWVMSAAFSPDGARIITTSRDGAVRLWTPELEDPIRELSGHLNWVASCSLLS